MRMYAREHDFSNKCRAFNGFLRVCERGYELAAAAAGEIPQGGGELKLVTPGRRWSWMSLGKRRACR